MTDKTEKSKNKVKDMSPTEKKKYEAEQTEYRKTNDFFKDAAEKRTNSVLRGLERIGYLGRYNGTEDQKRQIMATVMWGVQDMESALCKRKSENYKLKL